MPVNVHVLIRIGAGKVWEACEIIAQINGVKSANVVTGPYDVIVYAELPSPEDMRALMEEIHSVEGVIRTETCVAL
jgi:DNA-binding Lrp family transcriptional regulator